LGALLGIALTVPVAHVVAAQDATPVATPSAVLEVPLIDASGAAVGLATFSENGDGVTVTIAMEGLTPGEHGWHLHEMGVCDPGGAEPFESAGGHWNPTDEMHGSPAAEPHHTGDFGNFVATADGLAIAEFTTIEFSLGEGPDSVFDADGTAIIIHAGQDDLVSQPSGNSGPRFACGVVAAPMGTPAAGAAAATPVA
jgi:Cu-Zn family superoxide dismutase